MKTSDKLLLIFSLSALGVFGALHLVLYAKYRKGDILSEKDLHAEQFTKYKAPAPGSLFLQGRLQVNIIPSDTFYFELQKEANGKVNYWRKGDSLILSGNPAVRFNPDGTMIIDKEAVIHKEEPRGEPPGDFNPHGPVMGYRNLPVVNVYCGPLISIYLEDVQAMITGEKNPSRFRADIGLINAQLLVGEYYYNQDTTARKEFYDGLRIRSLNGNIFLNRYAVIRGLDVELDRRSEINDQNAEIAGGEIHYMDSSRVNLGGANLKKLQLITP